MKQRSFFGRVAAWLCAVPAALLWRPSPATGKTLRPRAVHGFVTFSRCLHTTPGTNAHCWASEVQQSVLHNGDEWLRLVACAERYLPFARVYVVSYVDQECRNLLQAFWNNEVAYWTYFPDSDTMLIQSTRVQKQRLITKETIERARELLGRTRKGS